MQIKSETDIFTVPYVVFIRLLEACNARCYMCGFAGCKEEFEADITLLQSVIKQVVKLGITEIRFTGGEPLLSDHLFCLLDYAQQYNLRTSLITNGILLKQLSRPLVKNRLSKLICSIDAAEPLLHNRLRGINGAFEKAISGLQEISCLRKEYNVPMLITVNTVVSKLNFSQLQELPKLLLDCGVSSWNIIPIKDKPDLRLDHKDSQVFTEWLMRIKQIYNSDLHISAAELLTPAREVTDRQRCHMVRAFAYIDIKNSIVSSCNCLIHRKNHPLNKESNLASDLVTSWTDPEYQAYRNNYTRDQCEACDSINQYLNREIDIAMQGGAAASDIKELLSKYA